MTSVDAKVAVLKLRYEGCFGCGDDNPMGLQLNSFAVSDGVVTARWTPRSEFQGFGGMLHGGVVTTALDEIMAWAAMLTEGVAVVTGTLEMRFHRPAPVLDSYAVEGQVEERRGRRLLSSSRLLSEPAGVAVASAKGMFLVREELAPAGTD